MKTTAKQLDKIIDKVTDALLTAQGVEYQEHQYNSVLIKRIKPDKKPLKKLMKNPLAKNLIQYLSERDSTIKKIVDRKD